MREAAPLPPKKYPFFNTTDAISIRFGVTFERLMKR